MKRLLTAGLLEAEVADKLGICYGSLRQAVSRHDLNEVSEKEVLLIDLMPVLGFHTTSGIRRHLEARGIPIHRRATRNAISARAADALRREIEVAPILTALPPGHVTVPQLAKRWNLGRSAVRDRLDGVPFRTVRLLESRGLTHAFDLRVAETRAPRIGQPHPPRGHVPARQVARMTGRTVSCVRRWPARGCPHVRLRHGDYCFQLDAVRAWLASHSDQRYAVSLDALTAHLAHQEAV